jgi:hypothetical protein
MKMEAAFSSETPINIYKTAVHHNPEDSSLKKIHDFKLHLQMHSSHLQSLQNRIQVQFKLLRISSLISITDLLLE